MEPELNQIEIIEALAKNEELVSELYKIYAQKFPEHAEFWTRISMDEISHASWLRGIFTKIKEGTVSFNDDRFNIEAIKSFSGYVKEKITEAKEKELESIQADSISLDIEKIWIENNFFEVFKTDSPALKHVLSELAAATKKHIDAVRELWLKEKEQNRALS